MGEDCRTISHLVGDGLLCSELLDHGAIPLVEVESGRERLIGDSKHLCAQQGGKSGGGGGGKGGVGGSWEVEMVC